MIYNALTTHRKLNVDHKLLLKCEAFTVLKTDELYLLVLNRINLFISSEVEFYISCDSEAVRGHVMIKNILLFTKF
jgi:hypothetical protein